MPVIVVDPSGDDDAFVSHPDRDVWAEVIDAQMITDPAGNSAVMVEYEHT
jgi:hypothetical protein